MVLVLAQTFADLLLPRLMARIVDEGVVGGDAGVIFRVGAAMLAVAVCGSASAVSASYFAARSALGFGRDLRAKVHERVTGFSLAEFQSFGTSTLITRTTNDVTQIQNIVHTGMHMLVRAPLMAFGSLALALSTDARLSLILLGALPFLLGSIALVARKGVPLFKMVQRKTDALNRVLREGLTGVRVVRAFNREEAERDRFDRANGDLTGASLSAQRTMALLSPVLMLVMNLTSIAVVWFGSFQAVEGSIRIGSLMAFLQYAMHILFSLMILSNLFVMLPRAQVSAERVNAVLDAVPSIRDPDHASAVPRGPRGRIEFRDVSFSYPGAEERALRGVSFVAEEGKTTAIIGGTGSGKSTLLALVPRFYDVDAGAVLVDGADVRDYPQAELRAKLGLVPQKAVLFSGSVADNIRYGKPGASDEEVLAAAETAQAADFVSAIPEGIGARVAQGGVNFSGGQKQRLSIARALARGPEIYLFDDSFSALDFKTDARLRSALKRKAAGATVLIVAQRVGTIRDADRIVVLDEGRVAGVGTHAELLASCAVYREIVESQFSEGEAV